MWFPDQNCLSNSSPGTRFVALRWHEFFDQFTPDSFQPRVCNLPTIVAELAVAAGDVIRDSRSRFHLEQLQAELKYRLSNGVEREACTHRQIYLLTAVASTSEAQQIHDTAQHLVGDGFGAEFEERILKKGREEISLAMAENAKGKERAETWLGAWATLALHRNYLSRDDQLSFDDSLLALSLDELLDQIRARFDENRKRYECVVEVSLAPEIVALPDGDRESARNQVMAVLRKVVGELPPQDLVGPIRPHSFVVHRIIETIGMRAALTQFVEQLQPALNLLGLYRNGPTTSPIRKGWAGTSLSGLTSVELSDSRSRRLHPRRKAVELTLGAIADRAEAARIDGDLANALELYHVAMTTEDLRVRFLTLWSAMECLGQSVDGPTTIARISRLVGPIVAWRRIEKHLRYIAINLKFARDWMPILKTSVTDGLPNATDTAVFAEDVLESLTKPDGHPRLNSLGGMASAHPLLLWRINVAWKVYHSPKHLLEELRSSRQRLEWQLGRIYRARNQLIHRGNENSMISLLTGNLQYYFSTTVSRLLHGLSERSDRSLREAAYRWCSQADYVIDQLSSAPGELTISDVFPAPDRGHEVRLWP